MERLTIKERMTSGRNQYIAKCRQQGIKMGRPASYRKSDDAYKAQYSKEISLLKKGLSLRNITAITGTSSNTLQKNKKKFVWPLDFWWLPPYTLNEGKLEKRCLSLHPKGKNNKV